MATIKQVRAAAEAITSIENRTELVEALATLATLHEMNEIAKTVRAKCLAAETKLSELCTEYAAAHQEVFDGGAMIRNQNGVHVGDITEGDTIHHLACGFRGYIRANGEKLTQDFIEALPRGWKKTKVELDVTGINKAVEKGADPSEYGLMDRPNNEWSHKSA